MYSIWREYDLLWTQSFPPTAPPPGHARSLEGLIPLSESSRCLAHNGSTQPKLISALSGMFIFIFLSITWWLFTCAYEHNVILAIFSFYFIHHYLGELVVYIRFDYDWSVVNGVDGVEHGWVTSGKGHHLIRKVLSCVKASECLAWTLWREIIVITLRLWRGISFKILKSIQLRAEDSLCQAVGREHVPGRAPTDSWVRLCERKDPETLSWCLSCCTYRQPNLWKCC